jgi:hypothetical protein
VTLFKVGIWPRFVAVAETPKPRTYPPSVEAARVFDWRWASDLARVVRTMRSTA